MRCHATFTRPMSEDLTTFAAIDQSVSPATTVCIVPAQVVAEVNAAAVGVDAGLVAVKACEAVEAVEAGVAAESGMVRPSGVVTVTLTFDGASSACPAATSAWNGSRGACVG